MTRGARFVVCGIADPREDGALAAAAAELATAVRLPLRLLHIREPTRILPPVPDLTAVAVAPAGSAGSAPSLPDEHRALEALARRAGAPATDLQVVDGLADAVLADVGRAPGTAWLVVGDRGRTTAAAALLGGVTRQLLPAAGCPLLVVPQASPAHRTHRGDPVVCFVADDAHADTTCATGAALASAFGCRLVVVHAVDGGVNEATQDDGVRRLLARCRAIADDHGVLVRTQLTNGDRLDGLLAAARAAGGRMLVVGGPAHSPVLAALTRELPHHLVATTWDPVLVVRPR